MEKALFKTPMEYTLIEMEKAWFYERVFFEVVIGMVKDKKTS